MFAEALRLADELRLEERGLHTEVPPVDGEVLERFTHAAGESHLAGDLLEALAPDGLLGRLAGMGAAAWEEEAETCVDDGDGSLRPGDDGVTSGRTGRSESKSRTHPTTSFSARAERSESK